MMRDKSIGLLLFLMVGSLPGQEPKPSQKSFDIRGLIAPVSRLNELEEPGSLRLPLILPVR